MKNFILALITLILTNGVFAQSLTCDQNAVQGDFGIVPLELPDAYVDNPYSGIITFKAPSDAKKIPQVNTIIDSILNLLPSGTIPAGATINVKLETYKITEIIGLPTGFTHTCNKTNCEYSGGDLGCLKIEGTATEATTHDLKVGMYVDVKAQVLLGPLPVYTQAFDTTLVVPGTYKLVVKPASEKPLSIDELSENQVVLYPNPAQSFVNINNASVYDLYKIHDMNGRIITEEKLQKEQTSIDIEHLKEGVYFIHFIDSHGIYSLNTHKLTIQQ